MKTTKLFFMAALALTFAACSNDDNDLTTQQPQKAEGITITAQLAPKTSGATTRAVEDKTTYIEAKWAVNEHIAILYTKDATKYAADAEITAVDGSGAATITFTVVDGTPDDTPCTLVYPLSAAKDDHTGVKDAATLLAAQDGTLNANLDVRVGAGTIKTSTPSLDVTTQPAAQFAIMKLTLANDAKNLCIMADNITIAGATLGTEGKVFTVAVPAVSSKPVTIVANDESNNCYYYSKTGVTIAAGKYYQSSPTMTALDDDNSKPLYKITATSSVTIPAGKTVVLSGVTISGDQIACSGDATIILMGSNSVSAADNTAAIKIGDSGTTLTITGSGSLTATGGKKGAGIGTGYANDASVAGGNIEINGGTIYATGGMSSAAIGTGYAYTDGSRSNTCGTITINGGSVTATGGDAAAGIGTASANGSSNECGAITINGGTVTATGGLRSAAIGTGSTNNNGSNTCGTITISTGVTSVTATMGKDSPNIIGKGYVKDGCTQTCGTVTFGATQVFDGSAWSTDPMAAGTYGGLNLAITNSNKTWTLTPAP